LRGNEQVEGAFRGEEPKWLEDAEEKLLEKKMLGKKPKEGGNE